MWFDIGKQQTLNARKRVCFDLQRVIQFRYNKVTKVAREYSEMMEEIDTRFIVHPSAFLRQRSKLGIGFSASTIILLLLIP